MRVSRTKDRSHLLTPFYACIILYISQYGIPITVAQPATQGTTEQFKSSQLDVHSSGSDVTSSELHATNLLNRWWTVDYLKSPAPNVSAMKWALDGAYQISMLGETDVQHQFFTGIDFSTWFNVFGSARIQVQAQPYLQLLYAQTDQTPSMSFTPGLFILRYEILTHGRLSVQIGRSWIAYGVRSEKDILGSMIRPLSIEETGVDYDWGLSATSELSDWKLSTSVSTGSTTLSIRNDPSAYILSARLSSMSGTLPFRLGISGLTGNYRQMNDLTTVERWRLGLDIQTEGTTAFLCQANIGQEGTRGQALMLLAELSHFEASTQWTGFFQARREELRDQFKLPMMMGVRGLLWKKLIALTGEFRSEYDVHSKQVSITSQLRGRW